MGTHKSHVERSKCWQKLKAPTAECTTDKTEHLTSFVHLGVDVLVETSITSDENTKVTLSLHSLKCLVSHIVIINYVRIDVQGYKYFCTYSVVY